MIRRGTWLAGFRSCLIAPPTSGTVPGIGFNFNNTNPLATQLYHPSGVAGQSLTNFRRGPWQQPSGYGGLVLSPATIR